MDISDIWISYSKEKLEKYVREKVFDIIILRNKKKAILERLESAIERKIKMYRGYIYDYSLERIFFWMS